MRQPKRWTERLPFARAGWLLALATAVGSVAPAPLEAAVVVFTNRTQQTVQFALQPSEGPAGQSPLPISLVPDDLVPVRVSGSVRVKFTSAGRETWQEARPNTIQCFVGDADELRLSPLVFSRSSGDFRPRVEKPSALSASVVPVKILVEADHPAVRDVWEPRLRGQLADVSKLVEQYCGVRFAVVAVDTWRPDPARTTFPQMDEDFRQRVVPDPGRLAIGFSSRFRLGEGQPVPHLDRAPFFRHLLVPDVQATFSTDQQLRLLAHELGHFLGAAHCPETESLMRFDFVGARGVRQGLGSRYDAVNTLVMNLVGDELRAGGAWSLEGLSRSTRQHLLAVYLDLAARLPGDQLTPRLAQCVREPALSRSRYLGQWVDGTRLAGDTLGPWHDTMSSPALAGRPLFDDSCPVRWVLDTTLLKEVPPAAWVEFVGGDVMPGRVIGFRRGTESPTRRLASHAELIPEIPVDWPDGPPRPNIRITTRWIRRIVWQAAGRGYQPQTLLARDGRQLAFRSARFTDRAIQVLADDGVREVPLEDVAELHLPRVDSWDACFEQAAVLSPAGGARLVQVETTSGLRATSSTERFQARSRGPEAEPKNWYHLLQPAWSLDPLWVPHVAIRSRRYFQAHEVPLSKIEPSASRQESDLGGPWPWQADGNVEGGPLTSGGQPFLWGFGVHATSELEFLLPPLAKVFWTRLGLDQLAGDGGSVSAKILLSAAPERPLFEAAQIIGSNATLDSGHLTLPAAEQNPRRLVLRVETSRRRPDAGADPFGIRAHFDWLEPLLLLDADGLEVELGRRAPQLIPAWQGWKVVSDRREGARLVNHWDEASPDGPAYRLLASASRGPLTLSNRFPVRADKDRLVLAASRPAESPPSTIEVRVDGKPVSQWAVPIRQPGKTPAPLLVSLEPWRGRQVEVELVQTAQDAEALVEWELAEMIAAPLTPPPPAG